MLSSESNEMQAQLDWYASQAMDAEAAARRLEAACQRALSELDMFAEADTFESAVKRLFKAREVLRKRHER